MATSPVIQIPQFAIVDVDSNSSRPQTPASASESASSATSPPTSPTAPRMDSLKVDDVPVGWRRRRSSSVSTMETLPTYSGPGSPTFGGKGHKRSNSASPSIYSEAPSYRTIPDDHDSTTYHLYRIHGPEHITLHEVPDRSLGLLPKATLPDGTEAPRPGFWRRNFTPINMKSFRKPDHPRHDPRLPAYFVHKPQLFSLRKSVPLTLRAGPNKSSPIACRFDGSFAWRKWVFDFEDINGEGVVDERGVIAEHFPRPARKMMKKVPDGLQSEVEAVQELAGKGGYSWHWSTKTAAEKRAKYEKKNAKKASKGKQVEAKVEIKPEDVPDTEKQDDSKAEIISPVPVRPVPIINVAGEPLSDTVQEAGGPEAAASSNSPQPQASSPTPTEGSSTPTPSVRSAPALKIDTSKVETPSSKPGKPSKYSNDVVIMTWENKLSRQYCFTYKDIKFFWKGTSSQKDLHNKRWGALNRFNHLKLVAELPDDEKEAPVTPTTPRSPSLSPADAEKPGLPLRRRSSFSSIFSRKSVTGPKKELVIATFTCTWGKRKAGRLVVDNTSIDKLVEVIAKASPSSFSPIPKRRSSSFSEYLSPTAMSAPSKHYHAHVFPIPKEQQFPLEIEIFTKKRLNELTVATCVAMANSEQEKRHVTSEVAALLLEVAQNAATG
ncbi:hypothetical protein ABW19_dt0207462 [Dactylella cylindrospora]|nr:hypothetical protein ABW19_dt0207462 [Dactylella cylindrospora]